MTQKSNDDFKSGREVVNLISPEATIGNLRSLAGKSILVTGGTGSFGRGLVDFLTRHFSPERLIVFSRDELKQFEMQQVWKQPCMRYFIGDVRDVERLETAMRGVDYVIHAAALKQVPTAEYNPFECVRTNIHGLRKTCRASRAAGRRQVRHCPFDRQGGQSDQSLRCEQARIRQDLHRGQRVGGARSDAFSPSFVTGNVR